MNEQQVIALINAQIKANDNKEITGDILNLVLKEMVAQPNLLIGDLSILSTGINDDLVSAINWLLTQISGGNIVIHTGQNNPNQTPPDTYTVGDFYSQLDVMNNPLYLWQYTGTEWARISNYIDDSIEALDTTWSSHKISEAIKGDRLNGNPTIVLDGNEIDISALSWWIQGNPYILIPPFSDTIPYTSAPGLSRKDIVVAIQANSLIRIPGDEGTGIVQPPQVPPNTLLVTEFDVYHDSVGETTEPITGDQYIKKSSEAFVQVVPTTAEIKLNIDNNRNFVVNAPDEVTIVGVVKTTTNGSTSTDTNWSGSDLHIYRKIGSNNVKIKHHDITNWTALGYTLYFPDGQDYDMEEGEMLTFRLMQHGTLITTSPIMSFPIYIFAGSIKAGGGGVTDGDKGDIIVSDTGLSWSVHKLLNVSQPGKDQIPKVLPDGTIEGEDIGELWVYDDTTSPYTLANLQTLYSTSAGRFQGFEVRCRLLTPPTTYRKESENDSTWIKIEGENVV